jgi:hypothetical protein
MLNPQFATNYHALQSLSNSYNIQWNGLYSMYALINLWAEKKTIGCKKIKIRAYYAYQRQNGTIGYWNGKFIYDVCSNSYTYILGSGNYASASDDGLRIKKLKKLVLYFYNPKVFSLDTIKNNLVQFSIGL